MWLTKDGDQIINKAGNEASEQNPVSHNRLRKTGNKGQGLIVVIIVRHHRFNQSFYNIVFAS